MTNTNRLSTHAAEQAKRLVENVTAKMKSALLDTNPEEVHQLRVALRRCQQSFRMAGGRMARGRKHTDQPCWNELLTCAGEVRDHDIAIARLQVEVDNGTLTRDFIERLVAKREQLADQLRTHMDQNLSAHNAQEQPLHIPENEHGDVEPRLRKLASKYLRLGRKAAGEDSTVRQLHRFRLSAKRLRYSLELFQTFHPKALAEVIAEVRTVQTCLGEANDCRTIRKMLRRMSTSDVLTHKLAKQLKREQKHKISRLREHWAKYFGHPKNEHAWLKNLNPLCGPDRNG